MKGRSYIGVVVPASVGLARDILAGIRDFCQENRQTRLVLISQDGFNENLTVGDIECACVITFDNDQSRLEKLRDLTRCHRIVVTSNKYNFKEFPMVISDDFMVGKIGASYLIDRGYQHLAYLHVKEFKFSRERLAGFREIAAQHHREVLVCELSAQRLLPKVMQTLRKSPRPIGIMAVSDLHARWLISCLEDPARWIPNRFAILGVDNDPLDQALSPLPLSSIALSGKRIGYQAAALGMAWAEGNKKPTSPLRIPPNTVVTRNSTNSLAYQDPLVVKALILMENHLDRLRDVSDLLRLLKIPRRTLENHFTQATHRSLGSFLTSARITKARSLLSQTDLSIKEIAYLIGFSEPRMLSLVFKRETGETPTAFRLRVR